MNLSDWGNLGQAVEGAAAVVGLVGGTFVALLEVRRHREFLAIERSIDIAADLWRSVNALGGWIEGLEANPIPDDVAARLAFNEEIVARQGPLREAVNDLHTQAGRARLVFPAALYDPLEVDIEALGTLAGTLYRRMRDLAPRSGGPTPVGDAAFTAEAARLRRTILDRLSQVVRPPKRVGAGFVDALKKFSQP